MRNLHKKISVVVLSGALLVGVNFQQIKVAHANSGYNIGEPMSISGISSKDKYESNSYVLRGSEKFGYKILGKNNIRNNSRYMDRFNIQYFNGCFSSGRSFISHLYECGIKKGVYSFWIGGWHFKIQFNNDIEPSKPWDWWEYFPGI